MSTFDRRDILRAGGVGAFLSAFANASSPLRFLQPQNPVTPIPVPTAPRLITIFLRGGQDGVYTVVPSLDPTYLASRPTLQPVTIAIPGSSFARLNQSYSKLLPAISAGHAALIHQVGNPNGLRSHFDEMQVYEGGIINRPYAEDGILARLRGLGAFGTGPVFGASVTGGMQQFYRGFQPNQIMAHVASIPGYTLTNTTIPNGPAIADRQRAAMATHLGQTPTAPIEVLLDAVGEYVAGTEAAISGVTYTHDAARFPVNPTEAAAAGLPNFPIGFGFLSQCEQAVELLRANIGCRAVGVELGAWDTHNDQAAERLPLDQYLAHGIDSLYQVLLQAGMTNTVILVVTEFGRTALENGNLGTDHGIGGLMMAFGPRVNGGVYNCHNGGGLGAPWTNLGTSPNNATPAVTDFRLVYAELFHKLLGMSHGTPTSQIATAIPGWTNTGYLGCFV